MIVMIMITVAILVSSNDSNENNDTNNVHTHNCKQTDNGIVVIVTLILMLTRSIHKLRIWSFGASTRSDSYIPAVGIPRSVREVSQRLRLGGSFFELCGFLVRGLAVSQRTFVSGGMTMSRSISISS